MFQANLLPGQGFMPYTVYKKGSTITATGRAVNAEYSPSDNKFFGILTAASQNEKEQWKQNGHPITHKIVEYSAMQKAGATDLLVCDITGGEYYVQGVKNPGNLNVTMIYFVEERLDYKERKGETI